MPWCRGAEILAPALLLKQRVAGVGWHLPEGRRAKSGLHPSPLPGGPSSNCPRITQAGTGQRGVCVQPPPPLSPLHPGSSSVSVKCVHYENFKYTQMLRTMNPEVSITQLTVNNPGRFSRRPRRPSSLHLLDRVVSEPSRCSCARPCTLSCTWLPFAALSPKPTLLAAFTPVQSNARQATQSPVPAGICPEWGPGLRTRRCQRHHRGEKLCVISL